MKGGWHQALRLATPVSRKWLGHIFLDAVDWDRQHATTYHMMGNGVRIPLRESASVVLLSVAL
jgi:hypothetical protein